MGLRWTRTELFKPDVRPDDDIEEISVPLALLLNPDLLNDLRSWVKDRRDKKGGHVVELGKLTRNEFLDWYRKRQAHGLKA